MTREMRLAAGVALVALVALVTSPSAATFSTTRAAPAIVVTSRSWFHYLHNFPTPPQPGTTTNSTAINLPLDTTAATGTELIAYTADISKADEGRVVQKVATPLTTDTNTKHFVDWWGPAVSVTRHYTGQAHLAIWAQRRGTAGSGSLHIWLRDRSSATVVTDITSMTYARTDWTSGQFIFDLAQLTIPLDWTLGTGHRFELRIMSSGSDMVVAYDTTAFTSTLRVP